MKLNNVHLIIAVISLLILTCFYYKNYIVTSEIERFGVMKNLSNEIRSGPLFKWIVNALFRLRYFKFNKCLLKWHFWTS